MADRTIDEYIKEAPEGMRESLSKLRQTIRETVPTAVETFSYGMPTFDLEGKHLIFFGAFKNHISLFPTPSPISAFKKELAKYKISKGTIQFPLDKPIPYELVKKITKFRINEIVSQSKK